MVYTDDFVKNSKLKKIRIAYKTNPIDSVACMGPKSKSLQHSSSHPSFFTSPQTEQKDSPPVVRPRIGIIDVNFKFDTPRLSNRLPTGKILRPAQILQLPEIYCSTCLLAGMHLWDVAENKSVQPSVFDDVSPRQGYGTSCDREQVTLIAEEQSGKDTVHSQQESMVQDYDETHDSQESGITTQVFRLNEDRAQVVRLESSSYFSEHVCG